MIDIPMITLGRLSAENHSFQWVNILYPYLRSDIKTIIQSLGYTDTSGECPDFEADYLLHSADKIVSKSAWLGFFIRSSGGFYPDEAFMEANFPDPIHDVDPDLVMYAVYKFNGQCADNIKKVYDAYMGTYNPLHNYDMVEDEDYKPLVKETITNKTKSDTNTSTDVYGFNSASPVPSGKSNVNQLEANNVNTIETTYDGAVNNTHKTRKGNIGVMSTQDLIKQELELRKLEIINLIFEGIDSVLTQSVYR